MTRVVRIHLPVQETWGSIPGPGRAQATRQLSPCATTISMMWSQEPQVLETCPGAHIQQKAATMRNHTHHTPHEMYSTRCNWRKAHSCQNPAAKNVNSPIRLFLKKWKTLNLPKYIASSQFVLDVVMWCAMTTAWRTIRQSAPPHFLLLPGQVWGGLSLKRIKELELWRGPKQQWNALPGEGSSVVCCQADWPASPEDSRWTEDAGK